MEKHGEDTNYVTSAEKRRGLPKIFLPQSGVGEWKIFASRKFRVADKRICVARHLELDRGPMGWQMFLSLSLSSTPVYKDKT